MYIQSLHCRMPPRGVDNLGQVDDIALNLSGKRAHWHIVSDRGA